MGCDTDSHEDDVTYHGNPRVDDNRVNVPCLYMHRLYSNLSDPIGSSCTRVEVLSSTTY